MRPLIWALAVAMVLPSAAFARGCGHDRYENVSGHCVHRPVHARRAPPDATAQCRDGTFSFSEHHQGTCSHHGGVETWL